VDSPDSMLVHEPARTPHPVLIAGSGARFGHPVPQAQTLLLQLRRISKPLVVLESLSSYTRYADTALLDTFYRS